MTQQKRTLFMAGERRNENMKTTQMKSRTMRATRGRLERARQVPEATAVMPEQWRKESIARELDIQTWGVGA